jgi:sodium-dependent dicarboxylate transporter 2/3/5
MAVFAVTALAWITRSEPFGGWKTWLDLPQANDASVALLAVVAMFVVPNGRGQALLTWERAASIPWGGMSDLMGQWLADMTRIPVYALIAIICLVVTFMTETTSNTASTTLLMPVLAAAALAANLPPELIMVPAAMSASCAFMLPVATAPNSVVFGSGMVSIARMAREGFALNLLGALVISLVCYTLLT